MKIHRKQIEDAFHWAIMIAMAVAILGLILAPLAEGAAPYCKRGMSEKMGIVTVPVPKGITMHTPIREGRGWKLLGPVTGMRCAAQMSAPLHNALTCVAKKGLDALLLTYNGCYCYRKRKGQDRLSMHAYGLAIDLNSHWNGKGRTPTMDPGIVKCFKESGFIWGGDWPVPDGMHFQLRKPI